MGNQVTHEIHVISPKPLFKNLLAQQMAEITVGLAARAPQKDSFQGHLMAQDRCDNGPHAVAQNHELLRFQLSFNPVKDHLCIFNLPVNGCIMAVALAVPCPHTVKTADGISLLLEPVACSHHDAVGGYFIPKKSMFVEYYLFPAHRRVSVFQQADHVLSPAL